MVASKHDSAGVPTYAPLRHDQFHKSYFGRPVTVQDVVVSCIRLLLRDAAAWIDRIDFSTLEPMPTEMIDKAFRSRFTDRLWRVRFRAEDGTIHWLHIIVMLEFQSTVDWFMALRMQSYAVRIYESMWDGRTPNKKSRLPPILSIVVYSGRRPWNAVCSISNLVGTGTRPAEPEPPEVPSFTGESYVLVDVQRLDLTALPKDSLVALLARAHRMRGVEDVPPLVDDALRVMREGPRAELREVFIPWFRELAEPYGIDLKFLEDSEMLAKLEEQGEVRLLVEERLQAQLDGIAARNLKKGRAVERAEALKRERVLLHQLAALRFGADTAQQLDPLLAVTEDPERLSDVGTWIMDCAAGTELLERVRNGH